MSRIVDSAFVRFSDVVVRLVILCSSLFWIEPNVARTIDTLLIAWSMLSIALLADVCVESESLSRPRPEDVQSRFDLRPPIPVEVYLKSNC